MGSGHRMAAVAAATHVRHTHTQAVGDDPPQYNVSAIFVSATLCGVLVAAVCAACWRRAAPVHKPLHFHIESRAPRGVYTVSTDDRLAPQQIPRDMMTGPPPAYDSVVILDPGLPCPSIPKDMSLREVVSHPRDGDMERQFVPCVPLYDSNGLPSYEAAVLLRDTKL